MYYGRQSDFESAEMTIDIVKNGAIATGDVFLHSHNGRVFCGMLTS